MRFLEPLEGRRLFTALVHQELHRPPTALMAAADINRDGLADLVVASEQARQGGGMACGFNVYLNDGKGALNFAGHTDCDDSERGLAPVSVAVGDVNGDGVPDVALLVGRPVGQPAAAGRSKTTEAKVVLFVGHDTDSDNDGKNDETDFTQRRTYIIPHVLDTSGNRRSHPMPHVLETSGIAIGDVNGDGVGDIVSWEWDTVTTVLSDPKAGAGQVITQGGVFAAAGNVVIAGVADLDGDGRLDLVAYDQDAPTVLVAVWDSRAQLTLAGKIDASRAAPAGSIDDLLVGDLDGDGRADDLVVFSGDYVTVGINQTKPGPAGGQPQFSFSWGVNNGPFHKPDKGSGRLIGDLDGDGKNDVFTLNAQQLKRRVSVYPHPILMK
jgi:hypothetical protein